MEADPDEEEMEDVRLNDKREHHWRMVLRRTREGCMMIHVFYILRYVMYKSTRNHNSLRLFIMCKFWVLMGRRCFGEW